ncbi:DUF397 domain-containing protein [Streptomyces sp. DH24]|uniref:DUF397 domain-containing protein n=1 Tax=Streptomyces sp. DH24 TaxID=3040123 RepID=UPI002440F061|nr:DUF397 domain-containing protein [Streptomyces sp. DH24]MDG9717109.1 DUF397 domain-containing protein [Streptomyces sp. DH24]
MSNELSWFKSSYSSSGSGDCVEVALSWRKSSYSSGGSGDCLEIATAPDAIHVRDSKNTRGPQLSVSPVTWHDFVGHISARSSAQQGRGGHRTGRFA